MTDALADKIAELIHAAKMVVQGSDPLTLLRLEQALAQIERTEDGNG